MKKKTFYGILLLISGIGLVLRVYGFVFALEYDEIWSLEYYAAKSLRYIFTDIALPNNHPLNSLQMKFTMHILYPWGIRIIPFLCGVLLVPLAGAIGRRFWGRRAGLISALLVAFSPPLIQYSTLARGYSLQLFLLALAGYALSRLGRKTCDMKYAVLLLACGICSVLTLPTSVFYLFPAGLYLLWLSWRYLTGGEREQRWRGWALLGISGGLALFVLLWFGTNFEQYRQVKSWGAVLTPAAFFPWMTELFSALGISFYLVAGAGVIAAYRQKKNILLVLMIVFPLVMAFFTNAAPARTFFPLLLLCIFLIAAAINRLYGLKTGVKGLRMKGLAGILLAAVLLGNVQSKWPKVDWVEMYNTLREIPDDTLIIYDSNDSLPLAWNNGIPALDDYRNRVAAPSGRIRQLAVTSDKNECNGLDRAFNVRTEKLPEGGRLLYRNSFPLLLYRLEPLKGMPVPGELLLIQVRPIPTGDFRRLLDYIWRNNGALLTCSAWFAGNQREFRHVLAVLRVDAANKIDFQELENTMRGAVSVYRIKSMPDRQ